MEVRGIDTQGGRPVRTLYYASKFARALACQEQVSRFIPYPQNPLICPSINSATSCPAVMTSVPDLVNCLLASF